MIETLESVKIEDIFSLVDIDRQCFDAGEAFSLEAFYYYLYFLESVSLIYREKSEIIGFIIFSKIDDCWELVTIDIKPERQGTGIGTLLMKKGLEKVTEKPPKTISLHVRVDNNTAINLYAKFGFNIVKTIKNYYNNNQDAYLMHKE